MAQRRPERGSHLVRESSRFVPLPSSIPKRAAFPTPLPASANKPHSQAEPSQTPSTVIATDSALQLVPSEPVLSTRHGQFSQALPTVLTIFAVVLPFLLLRAQRVKHRQASLRIKKSSFKSLLESERAALRVLQGKQDEQTQALAEHTARPEELLQAVQDELQGVPAQKQGDAATGTVFVEQKTICQLLQQLSVDDSSSSLSPRELQAAALWPMEVLLQQLQEIHSWLEEAQEAVEREEKQREKRRLSALLSAASPALSRTSSRVVADAGVGGQLLPPAASPLPSVARVASRDGAAASSSSSTGNSLSKKDETVRQLFPTSEEMEGLTLASESPSSATASTAGSSTVSSSVSSSSSSAAAFPVHSLEPSSPFPLTLHELLLQLPVSMMPLCPQLMLSGQFLLQCSTQRMASLQKGHSVSSSSLSSASSSSAPAWLSSCSFRLHSLFSQASSLAQKSVTLLDRCSRKLLQQPGQLASCLLLYRLARSLDIASSFRKGGNALVSQPLTAEADPIASMLSEMQSLLGKQLEAFLLTARLQAAVDQAAEAADSLQWAAALTERSSGVSMVLEDGDAGEKSIGSAAAPLAGSLPKRSLSSTGIGATEQSSVLSSSDNGSDGAPAVHQGTASSVALAATSSSSSSSCSSSSSSRAAITAAAASISAAMTEARDTLQLVRSHTSLQVKVLIPDCERLLQSVQQARQGLLQEQSALCSRFMQQLGERQGQEQLLLERTDLHRTQREGSHAGGSLMHALQSAPVQYILQLAQQLQQEGADGLDRLLRIIPSSQKDFLQQLASSGEYREQVSRHLQMVLDRQSSREQELMRSLISELREGRQQAEANASRMTSVVQAFSEHLERQATAAALQKLQESRQAAIAAPGFGPALKACLLAFSLIYSVFLWEHAGKSFLGLFFLPSQCGSSGQATDGGEASIASLQSAAAAASDSSSGLWNNLCMPLLLQQMGQDAGGATGVGAAGEGTEAFSTSSFTFSSPFLSWLSLPFYSSSSSSTGTSSLLSFLAYIPGAIATAKRGCQGWQSAACVLPYFRVAVAWLLLILLFLCSSSTSFFSYAGASVLTVWVLGSFPNWRALLGWSALTLLSLLLINAGISILLQVVLPKLGWLPQQINRRADEFVGNKDATGASSAAARSPASPARSLQQRPQVSSPSSKASAEQPQASSMSVPPSPLEQYQHQVQGSIAHYARVKHVFWPAAMAAVAAVAAALLAARASGGSVLEPLFLLVQVCQKLLAAVLAMAGH